MNYEYMIDCLKCLNSMYNEYVYSYFENCEMILFLKSGPHDNYNQIHQAEMRSLRGARVPGYITDDVSKCIARCVKEQQKNVRHLLKTLKYKYEGMHSVSKALTYPESELFPHSRASI